MSEATDGDACAVHASGVGKACPRCHGRGQSWYKGNGQPDEKPGWGACQVCGGTGLVDQKKHAPRMRSEDDPIEQRGLIRIAEDA